MTGKGMIKRLVCGALVACFVWVCSACAITDLFFNKPLPYVFTTSAFPAIYIDTNQVAINSKESYVAAQISLRNAAQEVMFEDVLAGVRGRGNSTWEQAKKPYRIKFDKKRTMFDSSYAAKDWTLIANHLDKSMLRNYGAHYLSSLLDGLAFSPAATFVDVYLNNQYNGVYLLSDQIEENAGRVEVLQHSDPSVCEYLLEWDVRAPQEGREDVDYVLANATPFAIKYPKTDGAIMTPNHIAYLKNYLTSFQQALNNHNEEEILSYIDVASFVDFYLVQELFKNVDIAGISLFFQIKGQGSNRKIHMGPIWDFDLSAGNAHYVDYAPQGLWAATQNAWYAKLLETNFANEVASRWNAIASNEVDAMIAQIATMAATYQTSFENNFYKWRILDQTLWPNPPEVIAAKSFEAQVTYLIGFLNTRKAWLTQHFNA